MNRTQIIHGTIGGLAGGLVFSVLLGMMGMLPIIGKMVGQPSALAGFTVHMLNSAIIGAAFGAILGRYAKQISSGIGFGIAYGGIWWLLGPLTLMPLFMGMGFGTNWNLAGISKVLPSLMGHAIFGVVLGAVFSMLASRVNATETASDANLSAAGE